MCIYISTFITEIYYTIWKSTFRNISYNVTATASAYRTMQYRRIQCVQWSLIQHKG